jgi:hypothetical protein
MSGEKRENGDLFNRAVKATAAYAEVLGEIRDLRNDLMGDDLSPGPIIRLLQASERLERNPMIQVGNALTNAGAAVVAVVVFLSGVATVLGGVLAVKALGLWP